MQCHVYLRRALVGRALASGASARVSASGPSVAPSHAQGG